MAYIDGFAVYYGLKQKGWRRLLWLDYRALLERFVKDGQELIDVKYFTSRVTKPEESRRRQGIYLDALAARGGLQIIEGKFESRPFRCRGCGYSWPKPKEKMTDVKIATSLLVDAFDDSFDTALLVTADADLIPEDGAVCLVQERFLKPVLIVNPRGRRSDNLLAASSGVVHINKTKLNQCQLPDVVKDGRWTYTRPPEWR